MSYNLEQMIAGCRIFYRDYSAEDIEAALNELKELRACKEVLEEVYSAEQRFENEELKKPDYWHRTIPIQTGSLFLGYTAVVYTRHGIVHAETRKPGDLRGTSFRMTRDGKLYSLDTDSYHEGRGLLLACQAFARKTAEGWAK